MTSVTLRELAVLSVTDPAQAARILLATSVPREALWVGLGLVAVMNALLNSLSNAMVPGPSAYPEIFNTPIVHGALVACSLILTVYALYWAGRMFGGTGTLGDIMLVIVWLQALWLVVHLVALGLLLLFPVLSALLIFGASLYSLFVLLHFINQAHQLGSLGRAAAVLIASILAFVLGLSLIISLFGGPIVGSSLHV